MKNKLRNIYVLLFLAFVFLGASVLHADTATGYDKNGYSATITLQESTKKNGQVFYAGNELYQLYLKDKNKLKNPAVVLSNKSIGYVKNVSTVSFRFFPKKVGTTKYTFIVKYGKKIIKYSGSIKVKAFENPFSLFEINGVDYTDKIKSSACTIKYKAIIYRKDDAICVKDPIVTYSLKKGWKLKGKDEYLPIYFFRNVNTGEKVSIYLKRTNAIFPDDEPNIDFENENGQLFQF
jgi:hypothetical protein